MSIARKNSRGLAPLAIALSLACLSPATFAAEGGFDRSFGVGGPVNVPRKANGFDMVLQADGNILTVSGSSNDGEEIARYNSDRTLDTGFADGGMPTRIARMGMACRCRVTAASPRAHGWRVASARFAGDELRHGLVRRGHTGCVHEHPDRPTTAVVPSVPCGTRAG
jgi:hypothetical protein